VPPGAGRLHGAGQNSFLDPGDRVDVIEVHWSTTSRFLRQVPSQEQGGVDERAIELVERERLRREVARVLIRDDRVRYPEPLGVMPERGEPTEVVVVGDDRPSSFIASAIWVVLLPGAAQASQTCSPGCGSSASPGSTDTSSCP